MRDAASSQQAVPGFKEHVWRGVRRVAVGESGMPLRAPDPQAAHKRAARREDRRRLEAGESPERVQAENSVIRPGSFAGARLANLWQAMGK
jgi:hypothetical protein